ncbi:MAG TPA: ACT domain-containing protein [Gemmatimonadaceae bacterium]|nr:ACT domain-containing protein [Gemmatimonadaceae bacterium]
MATRALLILSATEPDRPGLVADLARYVADCGCNVEDSRVSVLGGHAGLMFLVSGDPVQADSVANGLPELRERTGIRAQVRRLGTVSAARAMGAAHYIVHGSAIDHEGIIFAITDAVRAHGGNILELETSTESAPMSGSPLFLLEMIVTLPESDDSADRLREALRTMARTQSVDIEMERAVPAGRGEVAAAREH